jgi:methylase of polypeptide subunit release factors
LAIHQRVIAAAPGLVRAGGWLALECGAGQGRQVWRLFERAKRYDEVRLVCDAAGVERVAIGRVAAGERR